MVLDGSTHTVDTDAPLGPAGDPTSDVAVRFEEPERRSGDVWALRGPHDRGITFTTSDGNELGGQSFVSGMTWARDETAVMPAPDVSGDGQAGSVIACDASSLQFQSSKPVDNVALITLPTF